MSDAIQRRESVAAPHAVGREALLAAWDCDPRRGLSGKQAAARLASHGYNDLRAAPPPPLWRKFLAQYTEPVVLILLAAAALAIATGQWVDTFAILAIVLLNGTLGFVQEQRAERSLAALRRLSAPLARVLRDGEIAALPARELAPGDCIVLEAGDQVPADARLLEALALRVQEAALTGESTPVDKDAAALVEAGAALGERVNMVYQGTSIATGKARALVVATGMKTELGRIAELLESSAPELTPLQRRMAGLGKALLLICLALVAVIFLLQLRRGQLLAACLSSVSLAVAVVPEGLPAVVTITLALGLQRMSRRNALVRRLSSVETLGSVTVICTDKTGTVTRNEMTVRELYAGGRRCRVGGSGYEPRGDFFPEATGESPPARIDPRADPDLAVALLIGLWCNNAKLRPPDGPAGSWQVAGDPTEGALLVAAGKAGLDSGEHRHQVLQELPFDAARKTMSVVVRLPAGNTAVYTKGAPEALLPRCSFERAAGQVTPLTPRRRAEIQQITEQMSRQALRVLAFAYRDDPSLSSSEHWEEDLIFAGLAGMMDPPREEAKEAVARCRAAGIRPILITGDHPATALAVARAAGIAGADGRAITGVELDLLDDRELEAQVEELAVYARVSAQHKLRVVQAWKSRGQIVAMTGDGVNDAPAVKAADIGIAMGRSGTDATREAADLVLLDDNFASIVNAVEEGRGIFDNIRKFVHYLLSCNAGEILIMLVAAVLGWPAPLLPVQILWINLVTDGLPALALAREPTEKDAMRRPPRPPREPIVTPDRARLVLYHGAVLAAAALAGFWLVYRGDPDRLPRARTAAFMITALAQLFYSFTCRSRRVPMPGLGAWTNPYLWASLFLSGLLLLGIYSLPFFHGFFQRVFQIELLSPGESLAGLALALLPVTAFELAKLGRARE